MMNFPEGIKKTITLLNQNGFEAYVVGGAVRDCLMNKTPKDYDIATDALPEQTKKCLSDFKTYDTGIKHGTILAIVLGSEIEITTYRIDGSYKDRRRPDFVTFSKNLKEDLKRRDFTINALACSGTEIVDIFGGKNDIKNKIIRTVGNPDTRFNEDALRMMRALRFSSVLGFEIEENTKKSIFENQKLISSVSRERIYTEFLKLVSGENAKSVIKEFFPVLSLFTGITDCNLKGENLYLKLSSLYKTEKDAENSLSYLKADNKTKSFVLRLIKYRGKNLDKQILNKEGEEFGKVFDFCQAQKLISSGECIFLKDLKIKGNHLKDLGFSGEEIKITLGKLLKKVHLDNSLNNYETLKKIAEEMKNDTIKR